MSVTRAGLLMVLATFATFAIVLTFLPGCDRCDCDNPRSSASAATSAGLEQTPGWSEAEKQTYLHGSISTEVFPERVFIAFTKTYPELFPEGVESYGVIKDPRSAWPVGFSR